MARQTQRERTAKTFHAVLTRSGNTLNWVIIRIPFRVEKVWGVRGHIRIKGEINGFAFRSTLFPSGDGQHFLIVNKQMQKGGRVGPGMEARFRMEPDTEKRAVPLAPEFDRVLRQSKPLQKFYQSLSTSLKNDIARYVGSGKQAQTRIRRAEQTAERLMETMEAEIELPPIIRQVIARNPPAAEGWQRMSPSHRRMHLFGIFHSRTFEARSRRIEKAVSEMIEYAKAKKSPRGSGSRIEPGYTGIDRPDDFHDEE
jgi:uncharacterized protein YdeI (YjbR/CyaY-like superfamily)